MKWLILCKKTGLNIFCLATYIISSYTSWIWRWNAKLRGQTSRQRRVRSNISCFFFFFYHHIKVHSEQTSNNFITKVL